ncbi:hypothetical protein FEM48_Zijuj09G0175800 [Ziziphus jujuba var. spinosa]|uniref:Uncharacterized protein n=1 Tax=Ziziphus jujuba var. spinosa TaxID=714518 RepID=A0A978UUC9_ZIZJJ|nr:hypothetical protein FEM48_Zijuj09G0175800 [Ziziphus jujuba var. spinosa]
MGQEIFLAAQGTDGIGDLEKGALLNLERPRREGFEKADVRGVLRPISKPVSDAVSVLLLDLITTTKQLEKHQRNDRGIWGKKYFLQRKA